MRHRILLLTINLWCGLFASAQVRLSTIPNPGLPHPSAQLELADVTRGLLAPRMTEAQRLAISSPSPGLLVYQTNQTAGLYVRLADSWERLGTPASAAYWSINGNSIGPNDFLGTTNNQSLAFRVNNVEQMRIRASGDIGVGTVGPQAALHVSGNFISQFSSNITLPTGGQNLGAGRRMLYYPGTTVFRAGAVNGNQWTLSNMGEGSFATGLNNLAIATTSVAIGRNNSAVNRNELLLGEENTTLLSGTNEGNIALGRLNNFTALARNATALGYGNEMRSTLGVALGIGNEIRNHSQISVGMYNMPLAAGENARPNEPMEYLETGGGFFGTRYEHHTLFTIGNGSSTVLSNALLMIRNGKLLMGTNTFHSFYHLTLPNTNSNGGRIRARAFATSSDARLKKDIIPLQQATPILKALEPMQYKHHSSEWQDGRLLLGEEPATYSIGFIAQQVASVLPQLAHQPQDESTTLWSMNYPAILAVLVAGIQEQRQQIDRQLKRLEALQNQIAGLLH